MDVGTLLFGIVIGAFLSAVIVLINRFTSNGRDR